MSVYILAEIASAHMGDPDLCLELIRKAKEAGADGVKVQVWFPEEGDFSHMMDKFMGKEGYLKVIREGRGMTDTWLQYYGDTSAMLCIDMANHAISAKHKVYSTNPIIGHQLYPTPISASLLHKVEPGYGYADHSYHASPWAYAAPAIAIARGATLIEKHICLNREALKLKSKDWISALEPDEFKEFVKFIREAETAL